MVNDWNYSGQTGQCVMLLGRIPVFSLGRFRAVFMGAPVYRDEKWNPHTSRGGLNIDRFSRNVPGLTGQNTHFFWSSMFPVAAVVANNTGYPLSVRRAAAAFANTDGFQHAGLTPVSDVASAVGFPALLFTDRAVGKAIGQTAFGQWKGQAGEGPPPGNLVPELNFLDIEIYNIPDGTNDPEVRALVLGSIQDGLNQEYDNDPGPKPAYPPKWGAYAAPTFHTGTQNNSALQPNGFPLSSSQVPAAYRDAQYMASMRNGYVSMDAYQKAIVAPSFKIFQRDGSGNVLLSGDRPLYNRTAHTYTDCGYTVSVDAGEGEHMLGEMFRNDQCLMDIILHYLNRSAYPTVGIQVWDRHTTEQGTSVNNGGYIPDVAVTMPYNNRPVPADILEGNVMIRSFLVGDNGSHVLWSSNARNLEDGRKPNPGEKNFIEGGNEADQGTDGTREYALKGFYRLSRLGDFFTAPGKLCFFFHAYVNNNLTPGDRYVEKPRIYGKIVTAGGVTDLAIVAQFPAQDDTEVRSIFIWVNTGSYQSARYSITLTGRKPNLRKIRIDAQAGAIVPRDVFIGVPTLIATTLIRRGELNVPVPNGTTIPT